MKNTLVDNVLIVDTGEGDRKDEHFNTFNALSNCFFWTIDNYIINSNNELILLNKDIPEFLLIINHAGDNLLNNDCFNKFIKYKERIWVSGNEGYDDRIVTGEEKIFRAIVKSNFITINEAQELIQYAKEKYEFKQLYPGQEYPIEKIPKCLLPPAFSSTLEYKLRLLHTCLTKSTLLRNVEILEQDGSDIKKFEFLKDINKYIEKSQIDIETKIQPFSKSMKELVTEMLNFNTFDQQYIENLKIIRDYILVNEE